LGKSGKKLQELELSTATKISIPKPDEGSDLLRLSGTKEGIERARHEIQCISDEQVHIYVFIQCSFQQSWPQLFSPTCPKAKF
jgi:hypothetical protein